MSKGKHRLQCVIDEELHFAARHLATRQGHFFITPYIEHLIAEDLAKNPSVQLIVKAQFHPEESLVEPRTADSE